MYTAQNNSLYAQHVSSHRTVRKTNYVDIVNADTLADRGNSVVWKWIRTTLFTSEDVIVVLKTLYDHVLLRIDHL